MEGVEEATTARTASLSIGICSLLIFLFAEWPIIYVLKYLAKFFSVPRDFIEVNSYYILLVVKVLLVSLLTLFLIKRYTIYLFSHDWKKNLLNYLLVGLKWSIPILILHIISWNITSVRERLVDQYVSLGIVSIVDLSRTLFILFSAYTLIGALFEEIVFRGIIQQKMENFFRPSLSIFATAAIFTLAHCIHLLPTASNIVNVYLLGLLCGFAFNRTRSCISAFIPHVVNNTEALIFISTIQK